MRKIPKVYTHDLSLLNNGIGSSNNKEYCKCNKCKQLRIRRNKIYNKWYHKLYRYLNNYNLR